MSNYGLDLFIDNNNKEYLNKIFKYLSSNLSKPKDIQTYLRIIDKNMLKNEHFVVSFYINFLNKIESITKVDLNLIVELTRIDKDKLIGMKNNINLDGMVNVEKEYQSQFLVDLVDGFVKDLKEMPEITEEEFQHSIGLMTELVKDLRANNILFVGSRILNDQFKLGKKTLKGREDFAYFMEKETRELRTLNKESVEITYKLSRDSLFSNMYSTEPLFPHPLPSVQESWGEVKRGNTLGIMAGMSVGKTTLVANYMSKALEHKINVGLFASEMAINKYISRCISIIGVNKYKIFLATNIVEFYLGIEQRKYTNQPITKAEEKFLTVNSSQINSIEYILNQLFSDSSEDLGTVEIIPELPLEDIPELYKTLEKDNVFLCIVDHINGLSSRSPRKSVYEITNEGYVKLHGSAKKHGIATIITNHIPDEQLKKINDLDADLSNVRGANAGQSTKSLDDVLILSATDEQKKVGQMVVRTNKNRESGVFFQPILVTHRKEIGLLYESN